MNEHLQERFRRCPRKEIDNPVLGLHASRPPPRLNTCIRAYYEPEDIDTQSPRSALSETIGEGAQCGYWLSRPEFPTTAELLDLDIHSSASSDKVELAPNKLKGAFQSKEEYLRTHYELLREDAIRMLRRAVSDLRHTPTAAENAFENEAGIYEKVSSA